MILVEGSFETGLLRHVSSVLGLIAIKREVEYYYAFEKIFQLEF